MLVYFLIIVLLFALSWSRVPRQVSFGVLFLLMLFLCFGYMTGSDWRGYESEYYEEFSVRLLEPGYMLLSNLFSRAGINFWVFHILFKCLFFILSIYFIRTHVNKQADYSIPNNQFFFGLMLWVASFGFYMLIDCPFRNLISCLVMIPAFNCLLQRRYVLYYILTLLAISFHYSAVVLLFLPLVNVRSLSTKSLVTIYFAVLIVLSIGGATLIVSLASRFLPPILQERILYYEAWAESGVFHLGLIPRLLCLWGILRYRVAIVEKYTYGNEIISFCYFYLIMSLVYSAYPVLFRSALFLAPFYILGMVYALDSMTPSLKIPTKFFWFAIAMAITFTGVRSSSYVPYTNILYHYVSGKMYEYDYRDKYNPRMSPYYTPEQY